MSATTSADAPAGLTDERIKEEFLNRRGRYCLRDIEAARVIEPVIEAIERERCGKIAHDEYEKWKATDSIDGIGAAANIYSKIIPGRDCRCPCHASSRECGNCEANTNGKH